MDGQVYLVVDSELSVLPHIKAGKIRVLAVTGSQRTSLQAVPILEEAGHAGFVV